MSEHGRLKLTVRRLTVEKLIRLLSLAPENAPIFVPTRHDPPLTNRDVCLDVHDDGCVDLYGIQVRRQNAEHPLELEIVCTRCGGLHIRDRANLPDVLRCDCGEMIQLRKTVLTDEEED